MQIVSSEPASKAAATCNQMARLCNLATSPLHLMLTGLAFGILKYFAYIIGCIRTLYANIFQRVSKSNLIEPSSTVSRHWHILDWEYLFLGGGRAGVVCHFGEGIRLSQCQDACQDCKNMHPADLWDCVGS